MRYYYRSSRANITTYRFAALDKRRAGHVGSNGSGCSIARSNRNASSDGENALMDTLKSMDSTWCTQSGGMYKVSPGCSVTEYGLIAQSSLMSGRVSSPSLGQMPVEINSRNRGYVRSSSVTDAEPPGVDKFNQMPSRMNFLKFGASTTSPPRLPPPALPGDESKVIPPPPPDKGSWLFRCRG